MEKLDRSEIFTVPNLISLFRLFLVPWIILVRFLWDARLISFCLVAVSGISDVVDGKIARKYNCVSRVGRILDPVADKLTQTALVICLVIDYPWVWWIFALFVIKELTVGIFGLLKLKKTESTNNANWYGKLCTVVLYAMMGALLLFPQIPESIAVVMMMCCASVLLLSGILYVIFYSAFLKDK